ncbi:MAG: hypothetical protein GF307_03995 [candidate division Zixibacteria bacterium]|nr:hypothetical protein [candidate division Zixibacteria bacterium]
MTKRYYLFVLILIAAIGVVGACKKTIPPKPLSPGKVEINNESGRTVIIERYTHVRGSETDERTINRVLVNGASYNLVNLIDGTGSNIFKGGDEVEVYYKSRDTLPENPTIPYFSGKWNTRINGNKAMKLTSGGGAVDQ